MTPGTSLALVLAAVLIAIPGTPPELGATFHFTIPVNAPAGDHDPSGAAGDLHA
jgi:hypothetical protein